MTYCSACDRRFASENALQSHATAVHSSDFNLCSLCHAGFHSPSQLKKHKIKRHNLYNKCNKCNKCFDTAADLHGHLIEHKKKPKKPLLCPGRKCNRRFKLAGGLISHLESGACKSGVTREQVNQIAVELDKTNVVTNPARLVQGPDGPAAPRRAITSLATSLSFNGKGFECFLCHREFEALRGLNDHLASAVHDDKIYMCPKQWEGCGKEFSALSVLCHHVESQKCGIRRFNAPMQEVVSSMSSALKGKLVL